MRVTKTVLVTGANGFIGRETVSRLANDGWTVFPAMRHPQHGEAIGLDLEDPMIWNSLSNVPSIDAVVHLAAKVDFGVDVLSDLYRPNIAATSVLAEFAKLQNAVFVFASSALVAGKGAGQIGAETPVQPDVPYTKSKWLAEQLVEASGVRHSILRIGGVFGLEGPEHLGLNRSIKAVVDGKRPTQIGVGEARRNYIYVKDVAAVISDVLTRKIEGTHLVAGSEVLSIAEMLQVLCDGFLPGQSPERLEGPQAMDQVVTPSKYLTSSRSFREAVADMRASVMQ